MKTNNIIFHTTNSEEMNALKAFGKALRLKFEIITGEKAYNPEFVEKILSGEQDVKNGKGTVITMDDLNSLWK